MIKSLFICLLALNFLCVSTVEAQNTNHLGRRVLLNVSVKKTGPYLGYSRGLQDLFEIGAEYQFKKIKLIHPKVHGLHFGFNYNFKHNALGFTAGYWYKAGRLGLTFGGDVVHRTNFNESRFGLGPALGYRLLGFHLQAGYHLLTPSKTFETNTFFIRLRFTFVQNRDIDLGKKRKK